MTTVKHHISEDYPNGKAETARMFAYAASIAPLSVGDRVEVLVGGHRGEQGIVRFIGGEHYLTLTMDTGTVLGGFAVNQVQRIP
jgi:hypothetical protein